MMRKLSDLYTRSARASIYAKALGVSNPADLEAAGRRDDDVSARFSKEFFAALRAVAADQVHQLQRGNAVLQRTRSNACQGQRCDHLRRREKQVEKERERHCQVKDPRQSSTLFVIKCENTV